MTLDEFVEALRVTRDRPWCLVNRGALTAAIREDVEYLANCPLEAVMEQRGVRTPTYLDAEFHLGLPVDDATALARAADNLPGHDVALRARLLDALGLEARA